MLRSPSNFHYHYYYLFTGFGLEDGRITNNQIRCSSSAKSCAPYNARLNKVSKGSSRGGWAPVKSNLGQWLSVDFRKKVKIYAIATQGLSDTEKFVKSYRFLKSTKLPPTYSFYKTLRGNTNNNGIQKRYLDPPVIVTSVRMEPLKWSLGIGMRVEFYGCEVE